MALDATIARAVSEDFSGPQTSVPACLRGCAVTRSTLIQRKYRRPAIVLLRIAGRTAALRRLRRFGALARCTVDHTQFAHEDWCLGSAAAQHPGEEARVRIFSKLREARGSRRIAHLPGNRRLVYEKVQVNRSRVREDARRGDESFPFRDCLISGADAVEAVGVVLVQGFAVDAGGVALLGDRAVTREPSTALRDARRRREVAMAVADAKSNARTDRADARAIEERIREERGDVVVDRSKLRLMVEHVVVALHTHRDNRAAEKGKDDACDDDEAFHCIGGRACGPRDDRRLLVNVGEDVSYIRAQRGRDAPHDVGDGGMALRFDASDRGPIAADLAGELILGEPGVDATVADRVREWHSCVIPRSTRGKRATLRPVYTMWHERHNTLAALRARIETTMW